MVTWSPVSDMVRGPAAALLRIRRWAEQNSRAEERRCVVVPQEEACMTQTYRLSFNQEERGREKRGRGRHAGDRGEWEHTHSCNLITESSRLLPSTLCF